MMKRALIIFVFLVFASGIQAISQQKPFVFGFKAGPTLGWMKPDTKGYDSEGMKTGFTWGFIADFFLMENYGIVTGFDVVFLNGGLKMPYAETDDGQSIPGELSRKYRFKYVQIPVSFRMHTRELGKFRIFGQIGLGTNFLIGAKADDSFTPDEGNAKTEEDLDIYDDITFIRESLILGAGVDYSLGGSTRLQAAILFNNGFMDVLNGKNTLDPSLNNKATSNFLALEVGIVF